MTPHPQRNELMPTWPEIVLLLAIGLLAWFLATA